MSKLNDAISEFQKLVDINSPIIYINDFDSYRVDKFLLKVFNRVGLEQSSICEIPEWNPGMGNVRFFNKEIIGEEMSHLQDGGELKMLLMEVFKGCYEETRFVILREIQDFLHFPDIKTLLQQIALAKLYSDDLNVTIIIVSSVMKIPEELEKFVSFIELPYPDEKDIDELIDQHYEVNGFASHNLSPSVRKKYRSSLRGLTGFEIDRMLDLVMSSGESGSAKDNDLILSQKKALVKKSGLLELVDLKDEQIGGLDALQKYLDEKKTILSNLDKAKDYGVSTPKGVFIVGMPGCGKSLCAKVTAKKFDMPLLKFDMGSMMQKHLGESEERMRKTIKIAEAAAPCVLWVDEIEKAFTGVGGQESDTLTRMFGYFLTWMQEKTSSVYVIATANSVENLPPELLRKGRFDEIFSVNLPNKEDCKKIFEIHIKKRRTKDLPSIDVDKLSGKANEKKFCGADIEAVVSEAIEKCYRDGLKSLTTDSLWSVVESTEGIGETQKEKIQKYEEKIKECHFRDASIVK